MSIKRARKLFMIKLWIILIISVLGFLWLANISNVWTFNKQVIYSDNQKTWLGLQDNWHEVMLSINDSVDQFKKLSTESDDSIDPVAASTAWLDKIIQETENFSASSSQSILDTASSSDSELIIDETATTTIINNSIE